MEHIMSFYSFTANNIEGHEVSMRDFEGKVVIVVNTASECGLTPQFESLEKLYQEYKDRGLVILGFPCNQFGSQDPGSDGEILGFCQRNYGVSFPMFSKIDVNGETAHPLYKFLKEEQKGLLGSAIKWNFSKFLIDREGNVVERFAPTTEPEDMREAIEKLI